MYVYFWETVGSNILNFTKYVQVYVMQEKMDDYGSSLFQVGLPEEAHMKSFIELLEDKVRIQGCGAYAIRGTH